MSHLRWSKTLAKLAAAATADAVGRCTVRADIASWQASGYYAEKGKPFTVIARGKWTMCRGKLPMVGPDGYSKKRGQYRHGALVMQIGCHTDDLSKKEDRKRDPIVYERFEVPGTLTATPKYGGLIYFFPNDRVQSDNAGAMAVTLRGAVPAPVIRRNTADMRRYKAILGNTGAPWGEIEGRYIILTLPVEAMKAIDDPQALIEWYDELYLHYCELDGRKPGPTKTRYVPDVQISKGSMHSGNPIMYHLTSIPRLTTLDHIRYENWGAMHELGHSFQRGDYNFEGTTEVTCNVFVLYAIDKMKLTGRSIHMKLDLLGQRYLARGPNFTEWQQDSGTGLSFYWGMIKTFGWKPYKKMFRAYWRLSRKERPRTDDQKRDLFLEIMSKAARRNLGPYFKRWGIPVSDGALKGVARLPSWYGPAEPDKGDLLVGVDYHHSSRGPPGNALQYWADRGVRYRVLVRAFRDQDLKDLDAAHLTTHYAKMDAQPEEVECLDRWIRAGGVFIANPLTWVAASYSKKEPQRTSVNMLVKRAGIYFTPRYLRSKRLPDGFDPPKGYVGFGRNTMADHPITKGVNRIIVGGTQGVTTIKTGEVLIWGEQEVRGKVVKHPYLVLVPHGKGLVIGFQHGGLLADEFFVAGHELAAYDNAELWGNVLAYVRQHKKSLRESAERR